MNKKISNEITGISARINNLIDYLKETPNSFALKLGYKRAQTLYDILNMKSAPSYEFFYRFSISEYSVLIDTDWLLTGKGSMLREDKLISKSSDATQWHQLYKEMEAKADRLLEENGALKSEIRRLEADGIPEKYVPDASSGNKPKKGSGASSIITVKQGRSGAKDKRL